MSYRHKPILLIILSALAGLAGCGGSINTATPPPSGGFTNSNLNGTYVFSALGVDASGLPFSLAGSLQANGNGGITGGTLDLNDAGLTSVLSALPISGGNYRVTADGRGKSTLTTSQGPVALDFVLISNSHALVTRYDGNGTGSGTMDLQSSVTQAQLAGSYALNFAGVDSSGLPFATVGSFTLDASGNITSGIEDFNDQGFAYPSLTLTGNVVLGTGSQPGTATLTATNSSSVSTFGTLSFNVYAIDSSHLKFVETDLSPILGGDAYRQQGAFFPATPTTFVFTMAGGVTAPISIGGFMPIDGAGTVTGGLEDINDNGTVSPAPLGFSGTYAATGAVGGQTQFSLSGFGGASTFVAYPTVGAGIQMLEMDNGGLLGGVALAQSSGASIASSQGYGLGLAAVNVGGFNGSFEEDNIAEFTITNGAFNGLIDINDQGSLSFNQRFSGSVSMDTPATGRGSLTSNVFNGVCYAVDDSTVLFLETDTNQVGTGAFQLQTPGAKSKLAAARTTVLHLTPAARAAWAHRHK